MKLKKVYSIPQIEVIEINPENIIANSPTSFTLDDEHNGGSGGAAGAGRRSFWD